MPSTITTFNTFVAGTKARASEVNTNFSNFRGDFVPINEATASASNNTHYLGAPDHYWAGLYTSQISLGYLTTTAIPVMSGDAAATGGAYDFKLGGVTKAYVGASGMTNASLENSARTIIVNELQYTTVAYDWTVPLGHTQLPVEGYGGGGGGGGGAKVVGATAPGGSGGNGAFPFLATLSVTPGEILSIVVGAPGTPGAAGSAGGGGGFAGNGGSSIIYRAGTPIFIAYGGLGGQGGSGPNITTAGAYIYQFHGGAGNVVGAAGSTAAGSPSHRQIFGGSLGTGPGNAGGGAGGGSSYGIGGAGSIGTTTGQPGRGGQGTLGGGGGGGAGQNTATGAQLGGYGGTGGAGLILIYTTKLT
jgi:hypothetical protein